MTVFNDEEQNKRLDEVRRLEEESSTKKQADDMNIPYVNLASMGINMDALKLIERAIAEQNLLACFAMVGKDLSVAVKHPYDSGTLGVINDLENRGYNTTLHLASMASITKALQRYNDISETATTRQGLLDISPDHVRDLAEHITTNAEIATRFTDILHNKNFHKVSEIMELIFGSAIGTKASDVHIEPGEETARLRFRQDGVLQDIILFPLETYRLLNSRIKLLSDMKITNTAIAQDGRFSIDYNDSEIEIRTSLIPGPNGEGLVMRILNPDGLTVDFEKLGFDPSLLEVLHREIKKPNGMILTTGPTGSGKTTTLYSILKTIYSPEIKILTIEDPIEYHLTGVTQTQVDHEKGYDFSNGLRAALRQDPDIVMVGEIRDKETATTAINASLTGHLVLSTLHTNNAAGAIPRMIELGVSPRILPDALTVCMAQRLVRKLCPDCKIKTTPSNAQTSLLQSIISSGITEHKPFDKHGITPDSVTNLYGPGPGCATCNMTGYKGQVGLYEAILIDDKIISIIENNPSERDIRRGSSHQGIFTMAQDAVVKILAGITSIAEVESVVDLTEDVEQSDKQITEVSESSPEAPHNESSNLIDQVSTLSHDEHTTPSELQALVDYLKLLESTQHEQPMASAHDDIEKIQSLIINLLKQRPLHELVNQNLSSDYINHEIDRIVERLEQLKRHQSSHPDHGIAHQLEQVRSTIEKLLV